MDDDNELALQRVVINFAEVVCLKDRFPKDVLVVLKLANFSPNGTMGHPFRGRYKICDIDLS